MTHRGPFQPLPCCDSTWVQVQDIAQRLVVQGLMSPEIFFTNTTALQLGQTGRERHAHTRMATADLRSKPPALPDLCAPAVVHVGSYDFSAVASVAPTDCAAPV